MQSAGIRIFVLIALAALLANAQCYGSCGATDCSFVHQPTSTGCHHQKSQPDTAACAHQHAEFSTPEATPSSYDTGASAIATVPPAIFSAPAWVLLRQSTHESPPAESKLLRISILRV